MSKIGIKCQILTTPKLTIKRTLSIEDNERDDIDLSLTILNRKIVFILLHSEWPELCRVRGVIGLISSGLK